LIDFVLGWLGLGGKNQGLHENAYCFLVTLNCQEKAQNCAWNGNDSEADHENDSEADHENDSEADQEKPFATVLVGIFTADIGSGNHEKLGKGDAQSAHQNSTAAIADCQCLHNEWKNGSVGSVEEETHHDEDKEDGIPKNLKVIVGFDSTNVGWRSFTPIPHTAVFQRT
jgi:hypothetical protein